MQTFNDNQLALCADYLNGYGNAPSPNDIGIFSDDDFAMSAVEIAEISALAQKQLAKNRSIKLIPLLAIAVAAAVALFVFIPTNVIEDAAPALQTSVSTSAKANSADNVVAENGIASISWNFVATDADTLVIYNENGTPIIKKPIAGNSATVVLPSNEKKLSYKIERNAIDVLKKGIISIKK